MQENTLKCIMKTLFLPEKGCVCLRNNYHYQPQLSVALELLRHSERATHLSFVSLRMSYTLTWWGVPILSPVGYDFALNFKEEMNATVSVLCIPEVRSKCHAMQPGVAVLLLGKRHATR